MLFHIIINCTTHDTPEADEGWLFAIPRSGDLVDTDMATWRVQEVNWLCESSELSSTERHAVLLNCTLEEYTGSRADRPKFCCIRKAGVK